MSVTVTNNKAENLSHVITHPSVIGCEVTAQLWAPHALTDFTQMLACDGHSYMHISVAVVYRKSV